MSHYKRHLRGLAALALWAAAVPAGAFAQTEHASGSSWNASREELAASLTTLEGFANSSAYSVRLRARARSEADAVRRRLERGDFIVGDRIDIRIDGSSQFRDTVVVTAGPDVQVGSFGRVELRGVLRSEVSTRVRTLVSESVLEASVSAQPLLRVAVAGSVSSPGYVIVSPETRLDEVLTIAGGPAAEADLQRMEVLRGEAVVLPSDVVLSAIASGRTIGELGVEQGDMLRLRPQTQPWNRELTLQIVAVVLVPLLTLLVLR